MSTIIIYRVLDEDIFVNQSKRYVIDVTLACHLQKPCIIWNKFFMYSMPLFWKFYNA